MLQRKQLIDFIANDLILHSTHRWRNNQGPGRCRSVK
jgi:hypothetical protein